MPYSTDNKQLRDELAQAIQGGLAGVTGNEDDLALTRAADAVLVLVEQRIAEHDKELAAKIEAVPTIALATPRIERTIEGYRTDVLRVVRGDE